MVSARFPLLFLWRRKWQRAIVRVARWRQRVLNAGLSGLFEHPVQVVPMGHVALAAAMVLWFMKDGQRFIVMLRASQANDPRAKLPICIGLGGKPDMAEALKDALTRQLGATFVNTLPLARIAPDRVAAAPVYTSVDPQTGLETPMQMLMWVLAIEPIQLELMRLPPGHDLVLVDDATLTGTLPTTINPTHVALWQSIRRHLPKMSHISHPFEKEDTSEPAISSPAKRGGRVLN